MLLHGPGRGLACALLALTIGFAASCRHEQPLSLEQKLADGDISDARASLPARLLELKSLHADPVALAESLAELARSFEAAGGASPEAWETADELRRRELAIRREWTPTSPATAETLDRLADLAYYRGHWSEAVGFETSALELLSQQLPPRHPRLAAGAYDVVLYRFRHGDYRMAEAWIDKALTRFDHAEPAADPLAVADALNIRGELYRIQDRFSEAEATYRRGLDLAWAATDDEDPVVLDLTNNLVGLLKDMGRFGEAEVLYRPVLRTFESDPALAFSLPTAYLNAAEIYRLQGRYEEAEPLYRRALELARTHRGRDDPRLAVFLNQLAVLSAEQGELRRAEELYREALDQIRRAASPDPQQLAQTRHDLAQTLLNQRLLHQAEAEFRRALAARTRVLGRNHPETALTELGLASCLVSAGPARRPQALRRTVRALEVLERSRAYPQARIEAAALHATILDSGGERGQAIEALDRALQWIEELRPSLAFGDPVRARQFARYAELYFQMAAWQLEVGRPERALGYAERAKARVFLDQLAAARVDFDQGVPAEILTPLRDRIYAARLQLSEAQANSRGQHGRRGPEARKAAEEEILSAARELAEAEQDLRAASPLWRSTITREGSYLSVAAVREELAPREVALAYLLGDDAGLLFIVAQGATDLHVQRLELSASDAAILGILPGPVGRSDLEGVLVGQPGRKGLLESLTSFSSWEIDQAQAIRRLQALRRTLVPDSIRPLVWAADRVLVIPDGALFLLPFEALVDSIGAGEVPHYWLDAGPPIRYGPSFTALANLAHRPIARPAKLRPVAVVVSNPTFRRESKASAPRQAYLRAGGRLDPLPGTAREAKAIIPMLRMDGSEVIELEGSAAEESAVRSSLERQPTFLHLATHGLAAPENHETLASIALTPPLALETPENDGFPQLHEIYALKLNAELVVLSTCESRAGNWVTGEGVFALSRGFLIAGARRVVASLWRVEDVSTSLLMADLYRGITEAETDAPAGHARSLRDAKRALRSRPEYSAPAYWAPFILYGAR